MAEYTAGVVTVPVVPSFKGFHKTVGGEFTKALGAAGLVAGDAAGKSIGDRVRKSTTRVGSDVGTSIASGIAGTTAKVGDVVGRRIHSGLGAAIAKTGESAGLRIGTGLESAIGTSMARTEARGRTFGSRLYSGIATPLTKVGGLASGVFGRFGFSATTAAGLAGAAAIGMGVKFDAALEQATQGFTTMLGSAQKAKRFLDNLQQFAAKTPFQFPELVQASERLIAFGFNAKKVIPTLTAIGDTAAGLGVGAEGVNQIVTAIGQISAKGKVQSDELLQLTEAGVPALRILANQFGVSTAKMQQMVTDGVVPASKAIPLLLAGMEKGTKGAAGATTAFAGLMQRQSTTLTGVWSNFVDVANKRLGQLVAPALPYVKTALSGLTGIMQRGLGGLFSGGGNNKVLSGLKGLASSVTKFVTGSLLPSLRNLGTALGPTVHAVGTLLQATLLPAFKAIGGILTGVVGPALKSVTGFLANHKTALQGVLTVVAAGIAAYAALRVPMLVMTGIVRTVALVTRIWAAAQALLNIVMEANPIGLVIIGITALVAAVVFAYTHFGWFRTAVQAAWSGIQTAAMYAWNYAIKPVFEAIKFYISYIVIPYYKLLWAVAKSVWSSIATVSKWAWEYVIKPVWAAIKFYISNILIPYYKLLWSIAKTTFNGVGAVIKWVWNYQIRPTFDALKTGVNAIKTAFSVAVSAIGRIWKGLESATKKPVQFVVNTVYTNGIRKVWNTVAGLVHLPQLEAVRFARGGVNEILPGYTPGRDPHQFFSPTGGRVDMSGGEAIMRPEFTRAVGPAFVYGLNAIARKRGVNGVREALGAGQAFADGGVYGGPVQSFAFGGILDAVKHAGSLVVHGASSLLDGGASMFAKHILDPILGKIPGADSTFAKAIFSLPKRMIDGFIGWLKSAVDPKLGGDALGVVAQAKKFIGIGDDRGPNNNQWTRAWGMPGAPWCAMFVSDMIKRAGAQKHYSGYPTALAAGYDSMRHVSSGQAGDLATYNGGGHINIIEKPAGGHGYWTIGGNQNAVVQHGIRSPQVILRPKFAGGGILGREAIRLFRHDAPRQIDAHEMQTPMVRLMRSIPTGQMGNVTRALIDKGLTITNAGVYDDGGVIPPGLNLVANASRKPEALLNEAQWAALTRAGGTSGDVQHTTYHLTNKDITLAQLEALQRRQETLARVGRPH